MCTIIELDTVDSTNEEAKRKLSDIGHFTVISAKNQTSGRGILPSGKLMIETKGEIREFVFNDVSYLIPLYKKR